MKIETHKYKLALAKRMMTRKEVQANQSPFDSAWWAVRKDKRNNKQLVQQDAGQIRQEQRRIESLARHNELLAIHKRKVIRER